jgi:hypothetical protein
MADNLLDAARVGRYLARNNDLKTIKDPWNTHYQRLAQVFLTRKQDFTNVVAPGEFLYSTIFDNTGEFAAQQAASVFLSMLWPDGPRTFRLKPVEELKDAQGAEEFFRNATRQLHRYMDTPRAGLALALQEYEIDMQVFGTAGVGAFENGDDSVPVVYEAWGVKNMCISENAQGFVDNIYFTEARTVRQLVEEYRDDVAPQVKELYAQGKFEEKVEVLRVLEPRPLADRQIIDQAGVVMGTKEGFLGMATRTLHIDLKNKFIMREGGYEEFPVAVGRMIKTIGEVQGRSPAMTALPHTNSLNSLYEAVLRASEKQLDPPLGVLDDGRLGGGVIDTSAGALNVFNSSGRLSGEKPVFQLFTVGELQDAEKRITELKDSIMQAFSLDRLLDLNNQTQMTAFETSVRNRMRGESLNAMFSRQKVEVFVPLIERSFNILYRKGYFGAPAEGGLVSWARRAWAKLLKKDLMTIPPAIVDAIKAGLDIYDIEFISPAQRFSQSEKLQGIFTAAEFLQKMAVIPGFEEIADNVDIDDMARNVIDYSGSPSTMQRTQADIKAIREGRRAQRELEAKLNAAQQVSEVARNAAQARMGAGGGGAAGGSTAAAR